MLRSTNENQLSGWQWKISIADLEALTVPLVVFAIGYNRFEGEPDFDPVFAEHLNATVAKAAFFGLRNHASIARVRDYLRPELRDRLTFQPCPTTVASYLVPDLHVPDLEPERRVGFQVTFEERNELAGYDGDRVFAGLLDVARELAGRGYALDVISHHPRDRRFHDHPPRARGGRAAGASGGDRARHPRRARLLRAIAAHHRDARARPDDPVRHGQRHHLCCCARQAALVR